MILQEYVKVISEGLEPIVESEIYPIIDLLKNSEVIYTCGNGGSGSSASHFTQDLMRTCNLKSICLNDNISLVTAIANDFAFEDIFIKQLEHYQATQDDVLFLISGSGNSKNLINAVNYYGINTVSLTGFSGGRLSSLANYNLTVPIYEMRKIESAHSVILHYIIQRLIDENAV